MNIILIGFMGAGKSVIGKMLARRLDLEFVDLDQLITEQEGKSINVIFSEQGEPYFRKVEKEVALRVCQEAENQVIATGGGTLVDPETLAAFQKIGTLVWLKISPETIIARTRRRTNRPLLKGKDPESTIYSLLEDRLPVYSQADLTVEADKLSVDQTIGKILAYLKK